MSIAWTIAGVESDGKLGAQVPNWTWGVETPIRFEFRPPNVDSRFESLLAYVRSAALASTQVFDTQGRPHYEERLPAAAGVSSLVVEIVPGSSVHGVDAVWALVVGGQDRSRPVTGTRELELQVVPLALASEYSTRADVEAALGTGVV